jgi:hypothetical protein
VSGPEPASAWWLKFSRGDLWCSPWNAGSSRPAGTPLDLPDGEAWDGLPREARDAIPYSQTLVESLESQNSDLTHWHHRLRRR